jgi:hypothetical protein
VTTLLFLLGIHVQASAQSIEPGVWKDSSKFTVNGLPIPNDEKEECITQEQAKDVKTAIAKDLKKIGCSITKWKVDGARLEASLKCKNDEMEVEATGTVKGKFSKKSYELDGEAGGTIKEVLPANAVVRLRGVWARPCG